MGTVAQLMQTTSWTSIQKRDLFVNLVALLLVRAYAIEIAGLSGSGNEFGCFCAVWPIAVAALHTPVSARGSVARTSADALGQQTCCPSRADTGKRRTHGTLVVRALTGRPCDCLRGRNTCMRSTLSAGPA